MRKLSYPPVIVLLDVLFIFLFISIFNNKKVIEITIPEFLLPEDMVVVHYDKEQKKYLKFDNSEYQFTTAYDYLLDCKKQQRCIETMNRFQANGKIKLPDNILDEIAKISTLSFTSDLCKRLDFKIISSKTEGVSIIDYYDLANKNKCLSDMQGYDGWIKARQERL